MTNREAIEILKSNKGLKELNYALENLGSITIVGDSLDYINALDLSIQALEKQEPKKPIRSMDDYGRVYECPICGEHYLELYCPTCGQAIDWSE